MIFHPAHFNQYCPKFLSKAFSVFKQIKVKISSFFYPRPFRSQTYVRFLGVMLLTTGTIFGIYLGLNHYLLPKIRALTEATHVMPTDTAFNASGYDDSSEAITVLASEIRIATASSWFNGGWLYKKEITMRNYSGQAIEASSSAQITVNTKELYDDSKLQADCDDLRIAHIATSSANARTEIPRSYTIASGASDCSDSIATTITFPLQEKLWSDQTSDNYELYYNNDNASTASFPKEKALEFDGTDDLVRVADSDSLDVTTDMTVEAWVYISSTPDNYDGIVYKMGAYTISFASDRKITFWGGGGAWGGFISNGAVPLNTWTHVAGTYDGTDRKIYINGALDKTDNKPGAIVTNTSSVDIGYANSYELAGKIDEVRISDTVRYTSNFTPSKASFESDSNTVGLWHFDEGTGQTVTDSSSNSNDGTLGSTSEAQDSDPSWWQGNQAYSAGTSGSKNATLVCPFNGSTTCVDGETPSTETGAIRYSGGKSAMSFDGRNDYVSVSDNSSLRFSGQFTVEAWIYLKRNVSGTYETIIGKTLPTSNTWWLGVDKTSNCPNRGGGNIGFVNYYNSSCIRSNTTVSLNAWTHVAGVYDGSMMKLYIDGVQDTRTYTGSVTANGSQNISIGRNGVNNAYFLNGNIDEIRVSDTARYTENFTAPTAPFVSDSNTKLLLHFDENGDDPRNSGKAIDASGNGNHGTISGAKYVSGLVGVDSSATDTGYIGVQPYAGHSGVFIEEGTTNKITNPSFDHDTWNTNWGLNYFNYDSSADTFTASMAKRTAPGPFAVAPIAQGDWSNDKGDYVIYQAGSQINGNFYPTIDVNQGSIVLWVTPEWDGNDGKNHRFVSQASSTMLRIGKNSSNNLYLLVDNNTISVDASSWTAGNTYCIVGRWDTKNTLDGTNYLGLSVDDIHTYGITSAPDEWEAAATMIGTKHPNAEKANAIIEGLTIYRRPLYDGTYGIDVGNGDEILKIYDSDESGDGSSPQDPTLVTGSWDVVFALPTNSSTGALTTGTGEAWSHPHSSNVLYTDTTNTGGFMMNGTYTSDGWGDEGTPTNVMGTTAPERIFAGGYQWTNDAANEGIGQTASGLTAGQNYVVRAVANSDGTSIPKVQIWDETNDYEITSLIGTVGSGRTAPDVLLFTFELPTVARYNPTDPDGSYDWVDADCTSIEVRLLNTESSGTVYWHQIELLTNKMDNPSMEIGSGDSWVPDGWSVGSADSGDTEQETSTIHSGSSALQGNSGFSSEDLGYGGGPNFFGTGYYSVGAWLYGNGSTSISMRFNNDGNRVREQSTNGVVGSKIITSNSSWTHKAAVARVDVSYGNSPNIRGNGVLSYFDDVYSFALTDVSLTVTPASEANSAESSGLRIDGGDTLTQSIGTGMTNNYGGVKFKFTPRHDFDDADKFGHTQPVILTLYVDSDDYIKLIRQDDSTLRVEASFAGDTVNADWTDPPVLNAGTTYDLEIIYSAGSNLVLNVDGTQEASAAIDSSYAFSTVPSTVYFGSDNDGSNQYDCTITNFASLAPTENTTAPYYKFGSKSAKLTNSGADDDEYTINLDIGSTSTHTLSAYVYDSTSGNVGGTVADTIAKLYYNNIGIGTTYTDMGGGWWRLSSTFSAVDAPVNHGVQVKAGKTVYVDGVQLEQKSYATTYTDGSLGTGYSWSGTAHESTSSRSVGNLEFSTTNNVSATVGTISLWLKPPYVPAINNGFEVFDVGTAEAGNGLGIRIQNTNFRYWYKGSGPWASFAATAGKWHHVVLTWDSSNSTIVFYGNSVATSTNTDLPALTLPSTLAVGSNNSATGQAEVITSDLRIFDQSLTADEVADLYYQGLLTHSSASESDDRYESGAKTYISPVIDLSANGQWGTTPISFTEYLGGGTISYYTRSSADNNTWSDWAAVSGSTIASDPRRYFQWKTDLTAPDSLADSPVVSGMTVSYVEDSTVPTNPDTTALGWSTSATASADLTSGSWYNFSTPKFTWDAGVDTAGEGQSASGIDGYHILLSDDNTATPSANTGDNCYSWHESDDREFIVGTDAVSCSLSNNTYYFRIQTKDNSGNTADPSTLFIYKYDSSIPNAPASVSTTNVGYSANNEFSFYWATATDNGPSGVKGYEYKTGASTGDYSSWIFTTNTTVTSIAAYQEGQNFFYVRTKDNAGNYSGTTSNDVQVGTFYYNATAPTAPLNLVISPATTVDSQASSNVFDLSWDEPASFSGSIAKYHYCVNCTPSSSTMTETTAAQAVNRLLDDIALATQQGKNTFYILAEDNNTNSETGVGNRNFEAYASADFYASTTAPGAPTSLTISDASDRDDSIWRLNLAWEVPSSGGTPTEYHVYRSIDNDSFSKIGETTSTAYTDTGLIQSTIYYYKALAIDDAGSSSLYSNTVSKSPEGKYSTAPTFGGTPSVSAGSSTATITWTTARNCYGTVEYGKAVSYGSSSAESTAVSSHSIKITGLSSGESYHYRVLNIDESDLVGYERSTAYSDDYTFTTLSAPEISDVNVDEVGLDSAIISWKTRTLASTSLQYGKTTAYGNSKEVSTTASESTHTSRLTNLDHTTAYHFKILGTTVDASEISSDDYTFSTITFPKITAYVVQTDQSAGGTTVALAWSTNVPASSIVEYQAVEIDYSAVRGSDMEIKHKLNANGKFDNQTLENMTPAELASMPVISSEDKKEQSKSSLSKTHIVRLGSLTDGSLYILTLKGRDKHGNEAVSDPIRYITGRDTRPPVLSNMAVESQIIGTGANAAAQILVSWETDEPATSQVFYGQGTGSEYPLSSEVVDDKNTRHMVVLRELQPTSSYHLQIVSKDEAGNEAQSADLIAVTPATQESALDVVLGNLEEVFSFLRL